MELINKYTTDLQVMPSQVDYENRLRYHETFNVFMDLANKHAEILGIDQNTFMNKGLFWLTVKTRIRFYRRPKMSDRIHAQTWPVKPSSVRSDRCYRILDDDGLLAEGRTEWAIMDMNTTRLANMKDLFPQELVFNEEPFSFEDFPRITPCDETYTIKNKYTVISSDIDMGQHMNNVAYVRALMGMFSVQELKDMDIREITVIFKTSAHEGDVLSMLYKKEGDILNCGLYFEDGRPSLLAQIRIANA
ncbi:MAG: hypothetical protein IJ663_06065 [Spirochaetales bacterium]|nr:hypothetical protein [Spirochaetales bacterium]